MTRRRFSARMIVLPLVVLAGAWFVHRHTNEQEAQRVARMTRAITTLVTSVEREQAIGQLPGTPEAVRRTLEPALLELAPRLSGTPWSVSVVAGDEGPGSAGAATHTASVLIGSSPALHLRVADDGERVLVLGYWRP